MSELDRYGRDEVSPFRIPILSRVVEGAEVLDVGPWTGLHGEWLMANRQATVDGVEVHPEAAGEAAQLYRQVVTRSIEDAEVWTGLGPYDAILFLDVLEHLARPDRVLRDAHSLLKPGGVVLCSIPNVAHWRMRLMLLRGRWDYTESGLMDRTHLRWYTRRTARDLVAGAGYEITWEDAAVPQHPRVKVPQRWLRPELFGYQLYVEGKHHASD